MSNRERIEYLALGAAMANRDLLTRLLLCDRRGFSDKFGRDLIAALGQDKEAVARCLQSIAVEIGEGQKAAEAVVEAQIERGQRQRNKAIATRMEAIAHTGTPEQFQESLEKIVSDLLAEQISVKQFGIVG